MKHVAEDVACDTPAGPLTGAEALRGFMEPFAAMLTLSELWAAFGDESSALVMYDTASPAVTSAPAAELYGVRAGHIAALRIVFDPCPSRSPVGRSRRPHGESARDRYRPLDAQ